MVNGFIADNYKEIMKMAKSIVKNYEYEEVAHEVITQFLTYDKAQSLIERGEAMKYLSGMIHLSYYSKTSPYHKKYRQNVTEYKEIYSNLYTDEEYNLNKDIILDMINELMDEKQDDLKIWYNLTLLRLYSLNPNYSKISAETKIPRNAVTQGVKEGISYIREKIIEKNKNKKWII